MCDKNNTKKNRFLFFVFIIVCFLNKAVSQKLNEDSLRNIIINTPYDTLKVDVLQTLGNYQIKHLQQDSLGLITLSDAFKLAKKNNYSTGLAQHYLLIGNYNRSMSNWQSSIGAYNEMLRIAESIKNDSAKSKIQMMAFNNLGNIYNMNGDYNSSLQNRLQAMMIVEKLMPTNYNNKSIIYLNIASDYRQLKIYSKALNYLDKTNLFFDSLSSRLKMEFYYEYFENYLGIDSVAAAKNLLDTIEWGVENYNLSPFQKKDYSLMHSKLSSNFYLYKKKLPELALPFLTKYLNLAKEINQKNEITEAFYTAGDAYLQMNNFNLALLNLSKAYDSAKVYQLNNQLRKTALLLAKLYAKTGNMMKAYQFEQEGNELSLKIYDESKSKELNFLEAKYENEKKEKEIADLTISNRENELTVVKRNRLLLIGGISAGATLLLLSLLYRNNRQKRIIAEKDKTLKDEQIKFLERQQQVVSLQSMVNGQETERTRIAKDLHDGLGGLFSTVKMHFSTLQHEQQELQTNPLFSKSYELINTASEEVRRIAHNMMPEVLLKMGVMQATQELCNSISAGKLLNVSMQSYGMEKRLNASTEIMLFRIIQELLNNIIKHAHATEAIVQFNRDGNRLSVTVEDNGRGFNMKESDEKISAGLSSVKSRVQYLNGQLSIDSQNEVGTTILMNFLINDGEVVT